MLAVVQDYSAKINAYALGLLYQFVPSQFPQLADLNADPIVTYVAQVRADIARRNAALATLTSGSQVGYLIVYGGTSDAAGGVTSDMWIFDTLTLLWQVPVRSLCRRLILSDNCLVSLLLIFCSSLNVFNLDDIFSLSLSISLFVSRYTCCPISRRREIFQPRPTIWARVGVATSPAHSGL